MQRYTEGADAARAGRTVLARVNGDLLAELTRRLEDFRRRPRPAGRTSWELCSYDLNARVHGVRVEHAVNGWQPGGLNAIRGLGLTPLVEQMAAAVAPDMLVTRQRGPKYFVSVGWSEGPRRERRPRRERNVPPRHQAVPRQQAPPANAPPPVRRARERPAATSADPLSPPPPEAQNSACCDALLSPPPAPLPAPLPATEAPAKQKTIAAAATPAATAAEPKVATAPKEIAAPAVTAVGQKVAATPKVAAEPKVAAAEPKAAAAPKTAVAMAAAPKTAVTAEAAEPAAESAAAEPAADEGSTSPPGGQDPWQAEMAAPPPYARAKKQWLNKQVDGDLYSSFRIT